MTTYMPIVRSVLFFAIWFGVPLLVFLPRVKNGRNIGRRVVISTVLVWLGLVLHCEFIAIPVGMALAPARGNMNYDGAAYGSLIMFFGWGFGIISAAVTAAGYLMARALRRGRRGERTAGNSYAAP